MIKRVPALKTAADVAQLWLLSAILGSGLAVGVLAVVAAYVHLILPEFRACP